MSDTHLETALLSDTVQIANALMVCANVFGLLVERRAQCIDHSKRK
jgi:hypothetical protein